MISREEAVKVLRNSMMAAEEILNSLPPKAKGRSSLNDKVESLKLAIEALSQPERPKGRWVEEWRSELDTYSGEYWDEQYYKCPFCGRFECVKENFCPNCGADMRGEEE